MRVLAYSVLFTLLFTPLLSAQSPSAAVEAAHADLARVREDRRPYTRYLSLHHVSDRKELEQWHAVLCFWANSLSRESEIVAPRRIAANLWRIDLGDYRWDAKVWEKLAVVEPYFTAKIIVDVRTITKIIDHKGGDCIHPGTGKTLKNLAPGRYSYEVPDGNGKVKAALAPWLPAKDHAALSLACQSQVPLVRLDWFLHEIAVPNDRGTGYYDWLSLGNKEADFQALIGADVKKARELRKEVRAIVARSTVTLNDRAMGRVPTLTGIYWFTQDFAASTEKKNTLRVLDPDFDPDASEQYGTLPNGLFAFWLQNGKGERQDTAPDNIASDGQSRGTDRRVRTGLSCVRCHLEGIRPINDWARKVYTPPFSLEDRDYEESKKKRSQYLSDLTGKIKRDQTDYAEALKATNGLTSAANAKAVADLWDHYAERDRTLADVAGELGTTAEALTTALKAEAKAGQLDPVLAGLVQGVEVRAEHIEEVFALLNEILAKHKEK